MPSSIRTILPKFRYLRQSASLTDVRFLKGTAALAKDQGSSRIFLETGQFKQQFAAVSAELNRQIDRISAADQRALYATLFAKTVTEVCLYAEAGQAHKAMITEQKDSPSIIEFTLGEDFDAFKTGIINVFPEIMQYFSLLFSDVRKLSESVINVHKLESLKGKWIETISVRIKEQEATIVPFSIQGFEYLERIWNDFKAEKYGSFTPFIESDYISFLILDGTKIGDYLTINFFDPVLD